VLAAALIGSLVIAVPAVASSAQPPRPSELLYVGNASGRPVAAYDPAASGPIGPLRLLPDPGAPNSYWDPWTLAFDQAGNLYVQSFLSDATTFVFGPGGSQPERIFMVAGPDNSGIAVDAAGYEYVIGGEGPPVINVAAPGANGRPGDLYSVRAVRSISTGRTNFDPWPSVLSLGPEDEILAALIKYDDANVIAAYEGGPTGSSAPVRTIEGPSTGLGHCSALPGCGMSVTYSSRTGLIYAAVSDHSGLHLSEFAAEARGDVAPLRTIGGPLTGFTGKIANGLAVDAATGDLYVMVEGAHFAAPGVVEVFSAGASGDAAPLRSFTDSSNHFSNAQGIAFGPP
jgi:hypothetical protein